METSWDRHLPRNGKPRVWRREDCDGCEYPWFYVLPNGYGSIARTWRQAMDAVQEYHIQKWIHRYGLDYA